MDLWRHAEIVEFVERPRLVEQTEDRLFAPDRGSRRDTHVEFTHVDRHVKLPVLRTALFDDVHVGHDLDAARQRSAEIDRPKSLTQRAVNPEPHPYAIVDRSMCTSDARSRNAWLTKRLRSDNRGIVFFDVVRDLHLEAEAGARHRVAASSCTDDKVLTSVPSTHASEEAPCPLAHGRQKALEHSGHSFVAWIADDDVERAVGVQAEWNDLQVLCGRGADQRDGVGLGTSCVRSERKTVLVRDAQATAFSVARPLCDEVRQARTPFFSSIAVSMASAVPRPGTRAHHQAGSNRVRHRAGARDSQLRWIRRPFAALIAMMYLLICQ